MPQHNKEAGGGPIPEVWSIHVNIVHVYVSLTLTLVYPPARIGAKFNPVPV